ncbi:ABC transporter substrate-binding protein [Roseivivax sediminis]|uniref:Peptide/nickel transport system substrate-binding protein n=1 Tax=Roseivivax sediminis TaxID=936889 RepID=A0A1I1XR72_9RHOB|nr:ABC transporter substrate-binding protein [Roseivivax sediminis]SFE08263.1 peptide/nickel transport system substrate-binding protein [Roseivivax sediminis]
MSRPGRGHEALPGLVRALDRGGLSRREFLTRATAQGLTTAGAYAAGGLAARAESPARRPGGTLRIQQEVRPLKDPRTFDWSEIANVSRGWLEYLVEYQSDGTLRGMLLSDWEVNADATEYLLRLRPGVTWNDGTAFTAEDVARMFDYWCDGSVEGNAMAASLAVLVDPDTNRLRDGAVRTEEGAVRLRLPRSDATLIVALADYPAAVLPQGFDPDTMLEQPVGTGPYLPESLSPEDRAVLVRNDDHAWWGAALPGWGPATLERIEFIDLGTDPASWIRAIEEDRVDMLYENVGRFIDAADALGWSRFETPTAATLVLRGNQNAEVGGHALYANPAVRRALALAVDNGVCLELGYGGRGTLAANDHVAPIQPDHADLGPAAYDPDAARQLVIREGLLEVEHEIVTLDDGVARRTGEAMVALLRDAGIEARQSVLPGSQFWSAWTEYPLSITEWNHRPLGVQTLALAYRSGAAWNETGYANPDFDAALDRALALADPAERSEVMAELQAMLREDAVIVQPYWRALFRHARPDVLGAEMHPAFEIHLYALGFAS